MIGDISRAGMNDNPFVQQFYAAKDSVSSAMSSATSLSPKVKSAIETFLTQTDPHSDTSKTSSPSLSLLHSLEADPEFLEALLDDLTPHHKTKKNIASLIHTTLTSSIDSTSSNLPNSLKPTLRKLMLSQLTTQTFGGAIGTSELDDIKQFINDILNSNSVDFGNLAILLDILCTHGASVPAELMAKLEELIGRAITHMTKGNLDEDDDTSAHIALISKAIAYIEQQVEKNTSPTHTIQRVDSSHQISKDTPDDKHRERHPSRHKLPIAPISTLDSSTKPDKRDIIEDNIPRIDESNEAAESQAAKRILDSVSAKHVVYNPDQDPSNTPSPLERVEKSSASRDTDTQDNQEKNQRQQDLINKHKKAISTALKTLLKIQGPYIQKRILEGLTKPLEKTLNDQLGDVQSLLPDTSS